MKVLLVNKFHYLKGGSETCYFGLRKLLLDHGHEVIDFSMKSLENLPSRYSDYFIENIDYRRNNSALKKVRLAIKLVYSFEARAKLEKLINDYKPDIAHLHIFQHQITPSILGVLKSHGIPMVYTAHDFKMICPNYKMMLPDGEICERCKNGAYYQCFKNRCVDGSLANSLVDTVEAYVHKYLKSYDLIDTIITPSRFYKEKFMDFGIRNDRLVYIPNFLDSSDFSYQQITEGYFLYFGRLSGEKGIETLIQAMKSVNGTLKIAGTGPLESSLKQYVKSSGLEKKIQFLGFKTGEELKAIIQQSLFTVVPSRWYENAPYSVLEAMALGKPVIGSDMGGIPELVIHKETGLVFKSGHEDDLAEKINQLLGNRDTAVIYGLNARKTFEKFYTKEIHYKNIIDLYQELISRRQYGNYTQL